MSEKASERLEDLLMSPGWQLYVEYVKSKWGRHSDHYVAALEQTQETVNTQIGELHRKQVIACGKLAAQLVRWPSEELARLKRIEAEVTDTHPRPALDPALAGQSRRGGL